jgi:acyl-coenzyme A synthetase/AMP-(fatty) acid ligase
MDNTKSLLKFNKYKKYYYQVLKNFNSKRLFYQYYNEKKNYSDANKLLKIIISFIIQKTNKKNRLNIYVSCDKSFFMYVSILAIMLTNNVWIPLSKSLPQKRIREILKSVPPDMFFFDGTDNTKLFKKYTKYIFLFDKIKKNKHLDSHTSIKDLINNISFDCSAFIYFTSGSTGKSKGIMVSHINIISDVFAQKKHLYNFEFIKKEKELVFGDYYDTAFSIFFDIFFPAIYINGAISPGITKNEILLPIEHIKANNVNILVAVPSTIQRIKLYYGNNKIDHSFKVLIMTGEPFYLNVLKYLFNNFDSKKIFNCYGGTEMGNWIYFHDCKNSDLIRFKNYNLVPIGKNFDTVVPRIVNGELIAKGPMITLGYINKELNNGKFIFNNKNSTFFTGDLVEKKYGKVICKGRKDHLVKIRGYRIEVPFVEAKLRAIKAIEQCVVAEKKTRNYDNYLVAIVKPVNKKISDIDLKKAALKELPEYMIPAQFILVKDIPLNSNGKIDRKKIIKKYF